jgi:transposase
VPAGQQVEVDDHEQLVARVAAIDVAKASGMVCVRVPHATKAGKRITRVWQVGSTTNQILELAEQLAGEGIERVVVESTSDYWRPFVYLLEARGLVVWLCNARDARAPAGSAQDRQAGCGVAVQAERAGHAAALVRPARPDPPAAGLHPAARRPDRRPLPPQAAAGAGCWRTR